MDCLIERMVPSRDECATSRWPGAEPMLVPPFPIRTGHCPVAISHLVATALQPVARYAPIAVLSRQRPRDHERSDKGCLGRRNMSAAAGRSMCIAALLATGLLGAWAAWACHRAQQRDASGSDELVWAGLAMVLVAYSLARMMRSSGWWRGFGAWLRRHAKQNGLYLDRRDFQIMATIAVALAVIVLFSYGLLWIWHDGMRYSLAIGFASLAVGFGIIRFISLHEVDAWNRAIPWALPLVELTAAAGGSTVALARLHQLGEFEWLWHPA
jgi:hypothetical protein